MLIELKKFMSPHDINSEMPETNWFFRLDELDLLEFEYESLYREEASTEAARLMEDRVLAEQEELEDRVQMDLERLLGDVPVEGECPIHDHGHDEEVSVEELLTSVIGGDPLASEAYRFARAVLSWANGQSVEGSSYEHLFRVRANAPLVPAKLAFALQEERHEEDPVALSIAEKELETATVYLSRLLLSLDALCKEEVLSQAEAMDFLRAGEQLLVNIKRKWDRLKASLKFRRL